MTNSRTLVDVDKLDPNDSRPPYQQVSDALRSAIRGGMYQAGDKLPAHASIADTYGVSVGTVKRAFADLHEAGLIVTRQGQGSYVRTADAGEGESSVDGPDGLRDVVAALTARVDAIERQLAERPE